MYSFCAMYSLRMSVWIVPRSAARRHALLLADRDVEREQDRRGRVDRHRRRDVAERDPAEERLHVLERVDRDALPADLAERALVVGVVAHQRRHVERGREPRLAVLEQVAEALVRLLRGAEARELAHRPELAAVHRRIDAARERMHAGIAEVAVIVERRPCPASPEARSRARRSWRRARPAAPACARTAPRATPASRSGSRDPRSWPSTGILGEGGVTSVRTHSKPMKDLMRLFTTTVDRSSCSSASAGRPSPRHRARTRRCSGSSRRSPAPTTSNPIPVVVESSARFEARRAAQAVRGYGAGRPDTRRRGARRARHRRDAERRSRRPSSARSDRSPCTTRGRAASTCSGARPIARRGGRARIRERTPGPAVRTRTDRGAGARRSPRRARRRPGSCRARRPHASGASPAVPARGSRLERFVALETSFTSSVGLRFAATLQNLGGRRAVATSLSRPPESTEQIFHIDKFLERERPTKIVLPAEAAGLRRVSVGSFGELDVRTLLAVVGAPRVDATGSGWAGGRTAIYAGDGSERGAASSSTWDTSSDADEWARSVPTLPRPRPRLAEREAVALRGNNVLADRSARDRVHPLRQEHRTRRRRRHRPCGRGRSSGARNRLTSTST